MSLADTLTSARTRLGDARLEFRCCDTDFTVQMTGYRAEVAAERARQTALSLEAELNAFDSESEVARLNRTGRVENEHVARLVRRRPRVSERTDGVFDIQQGAVEHDLKAYLRGDRKTVSATVRDRIGARRRRSRRHRRRNSTSTALAEGLHRRSRGPLRDGAGPTRLRQRRWRYVAADWPDRCRESVRDSRPLKVLETDWSVATSGTIAGSADGIDSRLRSDERAAGCTPRVGHCGRKTRLHGG
ncbi:FAD:protein FMN transferase [Haloterrigena sp. H1]|uniref:FAD:protein FMN transferase n=1 Tax=Haloterrigena sp. H1 TaxID=2552943 RepID=UPI0020175052|nr:FAD:protein FMN transferase [Haloterrigena sp. H1]